jgi:hypothetical protein
MEQSSYHLKRFAVRILVREIILCRCRLTSAAALTKIQSQHLNFFRVRKELKSTIETDIESKMKTARNTLDAWAREIVQWHFDPATGCPFWLDYAKNLDWDPRSEIQGYDDLARFGFFQDEWLRGGPVR